MAPRVAGGGASTRQRRRSPTVVSSHWQWVVVAAVRTGSPVVAVLLGLVVGATIAVVASSPPLAFVVLALAVGGAVRSQHEWAGLAPDVLGPYEGWVRLVDDPQPYPSSTRVIVEIERERFELWSRGRAQQQRIRSHGAAASGSWSAVQRQSLDTERARSGGLAACGGRVRSRRGRAMSMSGGPVARASNRVRASIERALARRSRNAVWRAVSRPGDRRRPRPTARDDRPVPCERTVTSHRRVRTERRIRAGRVRATAGAAQTLPR
jgi:competence protein ComEC